MLHVPGTLSSRLFEEDDTVRAFRSGSETGRYKPTPPTFYTDELGQRKRKVNKRIKKRGMEKLQ